MLDRSRKPLPERCIGKWRGILLELGVGPRFLTGKHTSCPMCGGKDRFRYDDKDGRGTWICSQCGAGDGFKLAMARTGLSFASVASRIESIIETVTADPLRARRTESAIKRALNEVWSGSRRVSPGDPVHTYLTARVGPVGPPKAIRYAPLLRYHDDVVSYHPAMLAMVSDAGGNPVNIHRTYLTSDGRKADVPQPKKVMEGSMPKGCAVRLTEPASRLGIAEGIETALAASKLFGLPCWSALNSAGLAAWIPPLETHSVVIFGDNDEKFGGQAAALALAHRLACNERRPISVITQIPQTPGQDWADVLEARMKVDGLGL